MKMPQSIRKWVNWRRSVDGKKNGVVSWLFDCPKYERQLETNKRLVKRVPVNQSQKEVE